VDNIACTQQSTKTTSARESIARSPFSCRIHLDLENTSRFAPFVPHQMRVSVNKCFSVNLNSNSYNEILFVTMNKTPPKNLKAFYKFFQKKIVMTDK